MLKLRSDATLMCANLFCGGGKCGYTIACTVPGYEDMAPPIGNLGVMEM